MRITRKHLHAVWKTVEYIGAVAIVMWLMYPYPYTWNELGKMYPGAQYGVILPLVIYIWCHIRIRKASKENASPKASEKAPDNAAS